MSDTPANGNANPNNTPNAKAWFCPTCGGADVTASSLAGGDATCNICGWKGPVEGLAVFHFNQDMGSQEQILRNIFMDLRKMMGVAFAQQLGTVLMKWGFMDVPDGSNQAATVKLLSRYTAAAARGILKGVIEERGTIEKEKHGG